MERFELSALGYSEPSSKLRSLNAPLSTIATVYVAAGQHVRPSPMAIVIRATQSCVRSFMSGKLDKAGTLKGTQLLLAGFVLAATNFMVVLDTTIANVSVPHISGALGASVSQGTWVVTSYSVAEAVSVPLTGWLARRFGTVRVFIMAMIGFAIFSGLCGLSPSLESIVAFRVGQGFCGGPLMPLTQTLLLRIFPRNKHPQAMGIWAMTSVVAPIMGPILGGTISDNWSWAWIFLINIPLAILCVSGAFFLLRDTETDTAKMPIDWVGFLLMLSWIAPLQILLDLGRDREWLMSSLIACCGIMAAIGFAAFLIWELTDVSPIVDLRIFRHRGFTVSVTALTFSFATFFASVVILPQWLQGAMGYTATYAGYVTACTGLLAIPVAPLVAFLIPRVDPRPLVFFGISWLALISVARTFWFSGADFWSLALPQLVQGLGMPFFFIPLTTIALGAVNPDETASAAGLMSFFRVLAGAFGASIGTTIWQNHVQVARNDLVGVMNGPDQILAITQAQGLTAHQGLGILDQLLDQQSVSLATNYVFALSASIFSLAALIIWLAPKPVRTVDLAVVH
jgi:DHA2 family multidrug resistance protein